MTPDLIQKLQNLADKYETASFCESDPSQFLRWYSLDRVADVECASFIAAMLAFGNRKQFIPKIKEILTIADSTSNGVAAWILSGASNFPYGSKKFYRFYSYDDMHNLFDDLAAILRQAPTLGEYLKGIVGAKGMEGTDPSKYAVTPSDGHTLAGHLAAAFPNSAIVPKGTATANKRTHMFLRWMVRQNSPVDLGLWTWANPAGLLIPLDVHVMQEGINLGLLPPNAKATYKTAVQLSLELSQAFPGDPSRGDFALFGLGVDEDLQ